MISAQKLLKAALLDWKRRASLRKELSPKIHVNGICGMVRSYARNPRPKETSLRLKFEVEALMGGLMRTWPKHSGVMNYPIDDKESGMHPIEQYRAAKKYKETLKGNQGKLRHELVDFMLEQLS